MLSLDTLYLALGAYLLGSIPTGHLVARARGLDIRKLGSGNIGATNVLRVMGKGPGILVLLADALKGVLAVWLLPIWLISEADNFEIQRVIAALAVLVGHSYPCWLGFKGGKGVATSAGVLAALVPSAFLIALAVFLFMLSLFRFVSLASITAAIVLPFAAAWTPPGAPAQIWLTTGIAALVVWRHRSNVQRLLAGSEPRINSKSGKP